MDKGMRKVHNLFSDNAGITTIEYAFLFGLAIFLCAVLIGML